MHHKQFNHENLNVNTLTLGVIIDLVNYMVESKNKVISTAGAQHLKPRTQGSTSEHPFTILDRNTVLHRIHDKRSPDVFQDDCMYFTAVDADNKLGMRSGAMQLKTAWTMGAIVTVDIGEHGNYELVTNAPTKVHTPGIVGFILGPHPDALHPILYTWHPGAFMGSADKGVTNMTAVKVKRPLHGG